MDKVLAQNRFGLGMRRSPLAEPEAMPIERQLAEAIAPAPAIGGLPDSRQVLSDYRLFTTHRVTEKKLRQSGSSADENIDVAKLSTNTARQALNDHYRQSVRARFNNAVQTSHDFAERLVHFWSNHFAISADAPLLKGLAGPFEQEAIRPHIFGRFSELLTAVEGHPAMLVYLDQWKSIGPNSPSLVALRQRNKARGSTAGLNENLAREILELHTMGVRSGYSQEDVRQLALALTGRTVAGLRNASTVPPGRDYGDVYFDGQLHEPGQRKLLGRAFKDSGEHQAQAMLLFLTQREETAKFLATKLARHFVADSPPADLVKALATAYLSNNGSLSAVYSALIQHRAAWAVTPQKVLTPWEWAIAAFRALGLSLDQSGLKIETQLAELGQSIWMPKSPAGFPDTAEPWLSPSMVMRRTQMAHRLAQKSDIKHDPQSLAMMARYRPYSDNARTIFDGAASAEQRVTLCLLAPEFLRR